jgi:integrase
VRVPKYRLHKGSGQALVEWQGKRYYLGVYGSAESKAAYRRFIGKNVTADPAAVRVRPEKKRASIYDLSLAFLIAVDAHGDATARSHFCGAIKPVTDRYGHLPVDDFGPLALQAVRDDLIQTGNSRRYINQQVQRIRRMFRWGVSQELVPATVLTALETVEGLRKGKTAAREKPRVQPVEWAAVAPVIDVASPTVGAMIRLQWLTGMRSDNLHEMRAADIEQTDGVWAYVPEKHKSAWREKRLFIHLGPRCQEILAPFLDRPASKHLFSPRETMAWHSGQRAKARKTPLYGRQKRRKRKVSRRVGARYSTDSYRRAIYYGIHRANKTRGQADAIPHWFPHQLRHACGTAVRKQYGLEGSQVYLGHATADVTQIYAERDLDFARRIAREFG